MANKRGLACSIVLVILLIIGVVLLVVGAVFYCRYSGQDSESKYDIDKESVLRDNSSAYERWLNTTLRPTFRRFYIFSVTNAADVDANSSKPIVQERGPYTYRVIMDKENPEFYENGSTLLSYTLKKYLWFEPNMSAGSEEDHVMVPNIPAVALSSWVRSSKWWVQPVLALALGLLFPTPLFVNLTVSELLWGYNATPWNDNIRIFMEEAVDVHYIPQDGRFGIFHRAAGSEHRVDDFTVWTGTDSVSKVLNIDTWNGNYSLDIWSNNANTTDNVSNMINGTDGVVWPPHVTDTSRLYLFDPIWCRSVHYTKQDSAQIDKLSVDKFTQPAEVYNNEKYNRGFCTGGHCMPAGVLNATVCRAEKTPIMFSEPHFYQGDTQYLSTVDGLQPPEAKKHESRVHIEPLTGRVVNSSRKLQVNVFVERLRAFRKTLTLQNDTVFPVLWMDESFEMSEAERAQLAADLDHHYHYHRLRYLFLAMLIVGACLVFISVLLLVVIAIRALRKRAVSNLSIRADSAADDDEPLLRDARDPSTT